MILAQKNIIGFYSDLNSRQWNITVDRYDSIVVLAKLVIPAFQLFVDVATSATVDICDEDGNVISGHQETVIIDQETDYVRLKYYGSDAENLDEGYYCLKITTDEEEIWSDVFEWRTDVNIEGLINIKATSSNFALGINKEYLYDMTNITFDFNLKIFDYKGIVVETEELAREENGIILPYYTGTSMTESWILSGNKHIFKFLSSLRLLQQNGLVLILWRGETVIANDIVVEVSTDHGNFDLVDIELKIKTSNELLLLLIKQSNFVIFYY